jgi:hypothetical protein
MITRMCSVHISTSKEEKKDEVSLNMRVSPRVMKLVQSNRFKGKNTYLFVPSISQYLLKFIKKMNSK